MADTELGQLMRDLIRAQAHRCESPVGQVRINTEEKAKDGGCDGWTAKPQKVDDWLGDADTCWQFKAGSAGTPARLKGEVLKPVPKSTLESGGRFVVVASGCTNGKTGEDERLNVIVDEARKAGVPAEKIHVFGSDRLSTWCNLNPAVAAPWAGRAEGLWTLSDWSNVEPHRVPWQASPATEAELASQRTALDFEGGSLEHLHIRGQPGVGKTRLALELCRNAPWREFVIYIQQADDPRLQSIIDSAGVDNGVRLVVVADEVQPHQLRGLRDSVGRADGRIRLISIGHCATPDPTRIPALTVQPLAKEMAAKVVKGWHPSMPPEHIDFVVRFADGYVRLARLAADAVAKNANLDTRGLLSREEIRIFLDGMLGTGERRPLHVVAVLSTVGWTEDKQMEGQAVAKHLGLDWNDVRHTVQRYDQQLGIAPRGGRYRYISPTPLGIYLAVEAWTTYPDLLRTLPEALPSEGAKEAYYERLQSIASTPQAQRYAREELAFFFRIDDFVDAGAVRRWSTLTAADPDQAANNILKALVSSSTKERIRIGNDARREVVWTLVRLAWRPKAFGPAVKALALLAEAENETWANNATAEFIAKFQVFLGGTALPYPDRLVILDELVDENRPGLCKLVIRALARVGDRNEHRMGSSPASDELPEAEWHPSTTGEHFRSIESSIDRLVAIAERKIPQLGNEFIKAAQKLAMMLREPPTRPVVQRYLNSVRTSYPETREPLRRVIADIIQREQKFWKQLPEQDIAELNALHAQFEDASLDARLRQYLSQTSWTTDEQSDLHPLARELLESPSALSDNWSWLTSGDAGDAWRFGEALSDEDQGMRLAAPMTNSGPDLRVLCGYVCGLRRRLGDAWYDQWVSSERLRWPQATTLLFELAWRCGTTSALARQIIETLQSEVVSSDTVGRLAFGLWANDLELELLEQILQVMIRAGHASTALTVLEHRTKAAPQELQRWESLALQLVTMPGLIRTGHTTGYYWKELAMKFVAKHSGTIAAAIVREQSDRSGDTIWFTEHSEAAEVIEACVEHDSAAVWAALLPQLSSLGKAYVFSVGFPRGIIDRMPLEAVLTWVDENAERASIVAHFANKNLSSDDSLAAHIIAKYGDREDVAGSFFSQFASGSWSGPASAHWNGVADELGNVAKRTRSSTLRQWALDAERRFREMAERDQLREEEEELRGR